MPIPDTSGVPPFADFDMMRTKVNEIVAKFNNLLVNLDSLNVVSLTADHVDTGTLDANLVTIAAEDGSYSYTLDGTGIKANNGSVDTLKFDLATGLLTIVSALIQSATGYPKVELNSANTLIGAYQTANDSLVVSPVLGGSPSLNWTSGGNPMLSMLTSSIISALVSQTQLLIQSFNNMTIRSTGNLQLEPTGSLTINSGTGQTGTVYVSATSGGPANIPISFTKGIRTS